MTLTPQPKIDADGVPWCTDVCPAFCPTDPQEEPCQYAKSGLLCTCEPAVRAMVAELARLQAIVDKLPKTRDGVPMVPGGHYWAWCRERYAEDADAYDLCEIVWWEGGGDDCFNPEYTLAPSNGKYWEFLYLLDERPYSTREAAEAAKDVPK